jgi:hypothetical protein
LPVLDERGYLITAVNTESTDYVACARQLAQSLRHWHPSAKICLLTDLDLTDKLFDHVVLLPHGDQSQTEWKLSNDWQAGVATPFRQTIKLEADMLITSPIDHWWTMLEHRDLVISTGARDYYDQTATSRHYRTVFDDNNLPDVYNAVTYWRLSRTAAEFWQLVRAIFENWNDFRTLLRFPDDEPTTDLVYAIAAQIVGPEQVTMPFVNYPRIVHMKRRIIGTRADNWTQELTWEMDQGRLRINTVAQHGAFHYHVKTWRPSE